MRIATCDPGGCTGLGYIDTDVMSPRFTQMSPEDSADALASAITGGELDLVVCEAFVINAETAKKSRDGMVSIELNGFIRHTCRRADIEFVMQTPADAKKFATDEKLRKIGWYTKGQDHSRDAARHLLTVMARRKLIDLSQFLR